MTRKIPKKLTAEERMSLALLSGPLEELAEATFDGTLDYKQQEGLLFKKRMPAKRRRTTNPTASEIFETLTNGTMKAPNRKRMRRIEARIKALRAKAVKGDMAAAEIMIDMFTRSKRRGDFQLEEEVDRYPPNAKSGGKKLDVASSIAEIFGGGRKDTKA